MKQRFVRVGDELRNDDTVIVRGGLLDPDLLRADASRNYAVYGIYGISVFAVKDTTIDELAQQAPLARFASLTLMKVAAVRAIGLRLEPTGRNPLHYDIVFEDLDDGIVGLVSCEHTVWDNPYYEP